MHGGALHVRRVQALGAGVDVGHAGVRQQLGDGADGQREEGQEEVHGVLAGLREQHALRLRVHQKLQGDRCRRRPCQLERSG